MRTSLFWKTVVAIVMASPMVQAKEKLEPPPPPRDLAVEMGAPFHDHAVLQRKMKLPVWGWSKPGAEVAVEFAGQKHSAKASEDGKWELFLEPLEASFESREMIITEASGKREVLKDLLVGEVWMCSGQSNMQWLAMDCDVGALLIPDILARVKEGKETMPVIREVKITNKFSSLYPCTRLKGQWSSEWGRFSAIAFAFAYEIAREVKVPVAIVNGAFSTTRIQGWVPREGFAAGKDAYTQAIYGKILETDYRTPEYKAAWERFEKDTQAWAADSEQRLKQGVKPKSPPEVPGNMNGNRDATWMCNGKITAMAPYAMRGAIWNQGYASQDEGIVYRNNLHSLIRGWRAIWNQPDLPVYFHQFYAGKFGGTQFDLNDDTQEMRLGTWLTQREIPDVGMASQIDITGGVHYRSKSVPGQRLARHALKNQYGKDIIANGPMYKNYQIDGDKVTVELDHAQGLCLGQNMTVPGGYSNPIKLDPIDGNLVLFHLADENHVWHPAKWKFVGTSVELSSPQVKVPRGVAYGRMTQGNNPGIYNEAMLPMTPFIFYDHKLVVSNQWSMDHITIPGFDAFGFYPWPMEYFQMAGEEADPMSYGLLAKYYKLWLLAPQFAHNGMIQEGVPTRLYGKAVPKSVVKITFAGFEKILTMGEEQDEWEVTVPPMPASAEPKTLHVTCSVDGRLAHERMITNMVVGDVWYVAANDLKFPSHPDLGKDGPLALDAWKSTNPQLRMMMSLGKYAEVMPTRYKLNASGYPMSEYFPRWSPVSGLTQALAERIHAKTGKPVGIIVLNPRGGTIKQWTGFSHLNQIAAWKADYEELQPRHAPASGGFLKTGAAYLDAWRSYWEQVRNDPAFENGKMVDAPNSSPLVTKASSIYNQSICAFNPGNFKAILCLPSKAMVDEDSGAEFGPRLSAMANSWKDGFAAGQPVIDPHFVFTMPNAGLAASLTRPEGIKGKHSSVELTAWPVITLKREGTDLSATLDESLLKVIDQAVSQVYP